MKITFDPAKRDATFLHRGLDMARADEILQGARITVPNLRFQYGESRFVTVELLDRRMVVLAWTRRSGTVRAISLRKANARERKITDPAWSDPDDVPDLTSPEWAKVIEAAPVRRGRPRSASRKVSTTIRLDPDVIEAFKSGGPGWQSRINAALRKAAGLNPD